MNHRLTTCFAVVGALLLAAPAQAQVKKAEIIKEIQEAFKTWENISCSKLKFEYAGEQTTFISEKEGGILVFFGYDAATWSHQNLTYWSSSDFKLTEKGDLYKATIELNARDWWWSIGKEQGKIDIRTAVLHMIPNTIGFYVGHDPITESLSSFIKLNTVIHTLDPLHEQGAQFTYFEAGASCTQPAQPVVCGMTAPTPDAGMADAAAADLGAPDAGPADAAAGDVADAGAPIQLCIHHSSPNDLSKGKPLHWETQPIKYWIYMPDNAGKLPGSTNTTPGDGGSTTGDAQNMFDGGPPKACTSDTDCEDGWVCQNNVCVNTGSGGGDDDGCCRVGHSHQGHLPGALLLMLGLALLAWRARGRK